MDDEGNLVINAVSFYPTDKYECACSTIGKVKNGAIIPREYCYCCGGHFKFHYEIMLNEKLELIEIVSSPHDANGQKPCVFLYKYVRDK